MYRTIESVLKTLCILIVAWVLINQYTTIERLRSADIENRLMYRADIFHLESTYSYDKRSLMQQIAACEANLIERN